MKLNQALSVLEAYSQVQGHLFLKIDANSNFSLVTNKKEAASLNDAAKAIYKMTKALPEKQFTAGECTALQNRISQLKTLGGGGLFDRTGEYLEKAASRVSSISAAELSSQPDETAEIKDKIKSGSIQLTFSDRVSPELRKSLLVKPAVDLPSAEDEAAARKKFADVATNAALARVQEKNSKELVEEIKANALKACAGLSPETQGRVLAQIDQMA